MITALWVLAFAAALALATTGDDIALAQGCRGGGSPSPSGSASPSPSGSGGGFPPTLPVSLPPAPDGDADESVPEPAARPAPRLDPHQKVPVVTAQQVTCKSTITIAYDGGRNPKFTGKVGSAEPMCKRARDVTVKKVKRGPDQTVGKAVTNAKGKYTVPARNGNGRFFAKVSKATVENDDGETVTCQDARSKTIRP
ncbi:MAG TPA: hypothetical protein VHI71_11570 [Actinomycetota bacterium]|nr:hypothetical protein [Actinomycetota bacterium]